MLIRFRLGVYGVEVFNAGKWVPADDRVLINIANILASICKE